MKQRIPLFFYWVLAGSLLLATGCTDPRAVIDQNTGVTAHNWTYLNKFSYAVKIDDTNIAYNLYMNLRVTS
ncbi:MAG: hypothetical protein ACXVJD_13360, partial [Mucilaginibacter sp.]